MDEQEPSTSRDSENVLRMDICIICKGKKGPLSEKEKAWPITSQGLSTFIKSCEEQQDEVADEILPLRETPQVSQIRFHFACKSTCTDSRKRQAAQKCRQEESNSNDHQPKVARLSREKTSAFSWDEHCFICGEPENKKKGIKLTAANMKPAEVRENVLQGAIAAGNQVVVQRLSFEKDIFAKNAKYHKISYQNITSSNTKEANKRKTEKESVDDFQSSS